MPPLPPGALSWRLKVPLAITAVIVLTELVVTATLVTRALRDARTDLEASARSLSTVLARSLRDPLLRDDLWQAFEVVRTPIEARSADSALQAIVVLDAGGAVFVASDPRRLPLGATALPEPLGALAERRLRGTGFAFVVGDGVTGPELAAGEPIVAEAGTRIGSVLLEYDVARHQQRIRSTLAGLALISLPGLLILVPLGWLAGKRLA